MNRTKLLLFVVTILILASAIFSYVFLENNFLIRKWNIPLDPPGFRDAQQIGIAAESYAQGNDPLKENLFTSRGYQGLNYPRIWHVLFFMGINQSHTNLIGSIFTFLFFVGIAAFWFARKYDNFTYVILFVLFLSPPVMIGIERGNIEVVVFFVLAVALLINYYSTISGFILFLFAAFLKLHPVFSFVVFMREQKKNFWGLFISACVIFIGYVLFTLDLKQMYLIQPKLAKSSFGLNVFWMGLNHPRLMNLQISEDVIMGFKIFSYIVLALIFMGALILSVKNYNHRKFNQGEHLDAFRVGAGIYIGCFLMGNNFDYRLIFLIFTVPQLVAWLSDTDNGRSLLPLITLLTMVFSFWSIFIARFLGQKLTFLLEESSNWIVLAGLLYLFLASVPGWLNDYFKKPFSLIKSSNRTH